MYRLLDTTRAYAQARLDESGEWSSVAARHATYLCELLEQESRTNSGSPERSSVNQLGSVRAALEWAFSQAGDKRLGARLAAASVPMFLDLSLLRECYRWVELALSSLEPEERGTRQEMALQAALSTAGMFTQGNSVDARAALDRAISLAEAINEPREQLRLLGALHILLTRTGEQEESLALAQRAEQLAGVMPTDPAARALGDWMSATSQHLLGDQIGAELRSRTAINPSPASRSTAMLNFSFDHRIRALVVLGRARWLLGRADDALRIVADAVHDATIGGQPTTVAIALIYSFSVYLWTGEVAAAERIVEELLKHTEKHSLAPYHAVALGEQGQLLIHRGDFTGIELLRDAIDTLGTGRHLLLQSTFYSALAVGLAGIGRFADALKAIDLAIAETDRNHGRSFDAPEMLRIKGSLLAEARGPDDDAAEGHLLAALKRARDQSALGWELRVATTLSRLWARQERRSEARELLGSTYERFGQGFGTADLLEAQKLLATL